MEENTRRLRQTLEFYGAMDLTRLYEYTGVYPLKYHCGYEIAAAMVVHSKYQGVTEKPAPSLKQ